MWPKLPQMINVNDKAFHIADHYNIGIGASLSRVVKYKIQIKTNNFKMNIWGS